MNNWPQFTILGCVALSFAVHCKNAGKLRPEYDPVGYLISAAIEITILYFGGFFAPFGWGAR